MNYTRQLFYHFVLNRPLQCLQWIGKQLNRRHFAKCLHDGDGSGDGDDNDDNDDDDDYDDSND